jgi:Ni,Fe-hydrogenase III small subunit/NAD-dependent dihydropyrimidine dehydrogenase PreA subunit
MMFDMIERRVRGKGAVTVPLDALEGMGHIKAPMASGECDLCGGCVPVCPTSAISTDGDWRVDTGRCLWCGDCLEVCPKNAISYSRDCPATTDRGSLVLSREAPAKVPRRPLNEDARRLLGRSLAIREVDAGSCNGCEVEVNGLSNPVYDLERFGIKIVASPRHADMLLVTGPVTRNMEGPLMKTYLAAPEPRLVVAMGTCAISGCPFGGSYVSGSGVDSVLPVDIYIPGCPPHPWTVMLGLLEALGRI